MHMKLLKHPYVRTRRHTPPDGRASRRCVLANDGRIILVDVDSPIVKVEARLHYASLRQQGGPTTGFKRLSYIYIYENKRYICKVDFFDCFDPKFLLILNMSQSASCWGVFDFQCDSQEPTLTVFTCGPLPSTSATGS